MALFQRNDSGDRAAAQAAAIDRSQAVIEFGMDGTIIAANQNFLDVFGYTLAEVKGRHHSMFVEPELRDSAAYREFWARLNRGEFQTAEYKRIGKGGRPVWIQASYNPILDRHGKPVSVIKFATDITAQKIRSLEDAGKISAILRAQAVIEFDPDGTIVTANDHFLEAVGYALGEIVGRHHSLFVEPAMRDLTEYRELWARLNRGEYLSMEYKLIGKDGREVWFLASYDPILDAQGKLLKIVSLANDVTREKLETANFEGQIVAIGKSQAVIEFSMDGTILTANDHFLKALGYSLNEIKGRHHRIFVDPAEAASAEYRDFWMRLQRGEYVTAEFRRLGKGGREVFIQASYNPILDHTGRPFKVVKYATDTTAQVMARRKSENVCTIMESVAAGAEDLKLSVRNISDAMAKSRDRASAAVDQVENADQQAQRLAAAAEAMSGIVDLIGSIAGQINLLALNATIESARAGEAGRGFAVVASEVKTLAGQAKQATDRIGNEIESMNSISADVASALRGIKDAIETVSHYVTSTAASVQEQSKVTEVMSSNMRAAAAAANIG